MILRHMVLKLYESIIKRVHRLLLPGTLLILYFTAIGLQSPSLISIFSRIALSTIHLFAGFFLILIGIILLYDLINRKLTANSRHMVINGKRLSVLKIIRTTPYRRLVDSIFYFFLVIMACLGLILYSGRPDRKYPFFESEIFVKVLHAHIGWFLVSLVILMRYLKTH